MIEDKNPILDEDWKKYNFETALEAYKEYILFKKVCSDTEIIRKIIKQYEDKMTMDLTININERETYKDSNQLLKILEEYEKQSAQSKELQTSGTFSKLTKGVKNLSDKALETDRVRKKCGNIDLTGAVGEMVEGAFNVVTAPVTGIAKIAETENKNAVDEEKTNTTEAVNPKNKTNASKEQEKPIQGGSRTQKRKNYRIYNRKYTVKRRKKTIKNKK